MLEYVVYTHSALSTVQRSPCASETNTMNYYDRTQIMKEQQPAEKYVIFNAEGINIVRMLTHIILL